MPLPNWSLAERFALRPREQSTVAGLALALALVWGASWLQRGGLRGELRSLATADASSGRPAAFVVDVNQAEWPELAALPRIGETLAKRIVASRRESGPFRSLDQLDRVRGIGPKTINLIRPYSTVRFDHP